MGNTRMYRIFEETIVALYEYDKLTVELLDIIAHTFKSEDTTIYEDVYIESDDGKCTDQIVVETIYPDYLPELERWDEKYQEIRTKRWGWKT